MEEYKEFVIKVEVEDRNDIEDRWGPYYIATCESPKITTSSQSLDKCLSELGWLITSYISHCEAIESILKKRHDYEL